MRIWLIILGMLLLYFFLPLQCFIIGANMGMGIQAAVFRYQITTNGNSLIPITTEVTYVTQGLITEKSAVSILFWAIGTSLFTLITMYMLIDVESINYKKTRTMIIVLLIAIACYLTSCIIQYGIWLKGPAGQSFPMGIFLLLIFTLFVYLFPESFIQITNKDD